MKLFTLHDDNLPKNNVRKKKKNLVLKHIHR